MNKILPIILVVVFSLDAFARTNMFGDEYDMWNTREIEEGYRGSAPMRWQPYGPSSRLHIFNKPFKWEKLKENEDSTVYIDTGNVERTRVGSYLLWGLINYNSGDSTIYLHEYTCDINSLRVNYRSPMIDRILGKDKIDVNANILKMRILASRGDSKNKAAISKLRYRTYKGRLEDNKPIFDTYYKGDRSKGYGVDNYFEFLNEADADRYREIGIPGCENKKVNLKKSLKELEENQEKFNIAMMERKKKGADKFLELTKFSNLKKCEGSPLKGIDRPYYETYASKNRWTDCQATVYVREEIYMDKERFKAWERITKIIQSLRASKPPSFLEQDMVAGWLAKKNDNLILWEKRLAIYEREKNEIKELQLEDPIRIVKYIGEYKFGSMHGLGISIYNNGDRYVGEHKNNKRDGHGTLYYKDHSIEGKPDRKEKGLWKDDKIISDYRSP